MRRAVLHRKGFDGIACREAISEAGTHDSGEGCDQKAAFQIKLFDGGALLLCGHLLFLDRKSTRLNSSHGYISYAVFCLKKKNTIRALITHLSCRDIPNNNRLDAAAENHLPTAVAVRQCPAPRGRSAHTPMLTTHVLVLQLPP